MKIEKHLPGVHVKVYQGANGWWHGQVSLDQSVYKSDTDLPPRKRMKMWDGQHNQWHYDFMASNHTLTKRATTNGHGEPLTQEQMIENLDGQIAELLLDLLPTYKADPERVLKMVRKFSHPENSMYKHRKAA